MEPWKFWHTCWPKPSSICRLIKVCLSLLWHATGKEGCSLAFPPRPWSSRCRETRHPRQRPQLPSAPRARGHGEVRMTPLSAKPLKPQHVAPFLQHPKCSSCSSMPFRVIQRREFHAGGNLIDTIPDATRRDNSALLPSSGPCASAHMYNDSGCLISFASPVKSDQQDKSADLPDSLSLCCCH